MHESKKSKKENSLMVAIPESSPSVEVNIYNDGEKRAGKAGGSLMARENYENGGDVEGSQTLVDNWLETLKDTKDYNRKFEVPANVSAKYNYGKIKADSDFQRVQQDAEGLGILDVESKELNQILQDVRRNQNWERAVKNTDNPNNILTATILSNKYNEKDPVLNALKEGHTPDLPRRDKESLETRIKTFLGFEDEEAPTKKPEIDRVYTKADMEMLRRYKDEDAMVKHANASGLAEQQGGQMANEERPRKFAGGNTDNGLMQQTAAAINIPDSQKPNVITAAPDLKTVAALDYATTTEGQIALDKQALDPNRQMAKEGGKFPDLNKDGKVTQADILKGRGVFQEGGEMVMPPELMEQDVPVDTYPNMTPEEEAMPVASDEQMQEDYVDYVTAEVLTQDEQNYLNSALDNDPQLEGILDKVVTYAAEFTGEGEVDGPGTGISDSIPARLSDGEFVITEKATDQIGADNLQTMMDEAERAADGGMMQKYALGGAVQNSILGGAVKDTTPLMDEKTEMYGTTRQDDEMKKQMMYANRMPSIIGR